MLSFTAPISRTINTIHVWIFIMLSISSPSLQANSYFSLIVLTFFKIPYLALNVMRYKLLFLFCMYTSIVNSLFIATK